MCNMLDTQKTARKKLALVIPCYNEAAGIAQVIKDLPAQDLADAGVDVRVYVIDNNSTDDTAAVARTAGATVLFEAKKGKGNALRTGFRGVASDTDYVVMLDGDNTYSSSEILRLIEPLRSNFSDVVVGSRLEGRMLASSMNRLNYIGNKLFTLGVRWFYGANVTDVLTGYFAWKKTVIDDLEPRIESSGFAIEMEMITKMARLGYTLTSVPISYHPRAGESSLHPFRDGLAILKMLIKNLFWRSHRQRPVTSEELAAISQGDKPLPSRRKIVFVSDAVYPYMKGGKEKRLHEITKRLAAMGHDVHIYTMHWWKSPDTTWFEDGVYLHALCKYRAMYHGDRRTIKEAVVFALACLKLIRVRFDVLDVDHMPFFPVLSTWLVCKLRGRKLYATWHEALSRKEWVTYMGNMGLVAAIIERLSTRLPYRITAASAHTKGQLESIHGRVKRVELVASGLDGSLLGRVRPAKVHCDVLYVGRLVKDKHVDMLIESLVPVAAERPDIRCIIIGQGLERARLEALVAERGLKKQIRFMDPLPEAKQVYAYMKAARVFCSPSVREGFGITSLEALACGTPVITVDSPSNAVRHLVRPGVNGSIVPLEPAAIAEAVSQWLSAGDKPSITHTVPDYDWHALAVKQAEVYML